MCCRGEIRRRSSLRTRLIVIVASLVNFEVLLPHKANGYTLHMHMNTDISDQLLGVAEKNIGSASESFGSGGSSGNDRLL